MQATPFIVASFLYAGLTVLLKPWGRHLDATQERLKQVREMGKNQDALMVDVMTLPFAERFLKPLVDELIRVVASVVPLKKESQVKLAGKLSKAGIPMSAKDYRAMNILIILAFSVIGAYIGISSHSAAIEILLYGFLGLFMGYVYRRFALEKKISGRKERIQNLLPEVMDLLSVSVVAGLGFDQALGYVVEKSEGDLIDELDITQREISLGKPRKEALKNFSDRCEIEEVKAFVSAVIQADELGISMQNVLNAQASMIRLAHKQKIEEKAMKIPVKILLPMVIFIFPVIFIILLGPAVPSLMSALQGI